MRPVQRLQTETTGAALYENICQGRHMKDGSGAVGAGAYPSLAANPDLADASTPIYFVLNGHGAMPSLGGALDDDQIAGVVNYVRSHFRNHFDPSASPSDVHSARTPGATYFKLD